MNAADAEKVIRPPYETMIEEFVDDWFAGEDVVDLERMVEALHFLVNGKSGPVPGPLGMAFNIRTGYNPDDEWPIQYLPPSDVATIAKALRGVTREQFSANYDPDKMEEANFMYADEVSEEEHMWELFERARDHYAKAAAGGQAMFIIAS